MSSELKFHHKKIEWKNYIFNSFRVDHSLKPTHIKPTHTSIGSPKVNGVREHPGGSFNIPEECQENFYKRYAEFGFKWDIDLHLTESHKDVGPVLVDLDFRYNSSDSERKFDFNFIKNIVSFYSEIIDSCYTHLPKEHLEAYVLLKDNTVYDDKKKIFKDGIHIIYPYLVTSPDIQIYFRTAILKDKIKLNDIFKNFECKNEFRDIFDERVIYKNNWLLYGSKKPNNIPYKLKYILDSECNEIKENLLEDTYDVNCELVKLFSIRNKTKTKIDLNSENLKMDKWLTTSSEKIKKKVNNVNVSKKLVKRSIENIKVYGKSAEIENLEYIKELVVNCLSTERADNHENWLKLGILLHNIDYTLKDTWITFSKKSPKFVEGECDEMWDNLPVSNNKSTNSVSPELSMGSLIYWCKEDDLEKYKEIHSKYNKNISPNSTLYKLLYKSAGAAHTDIANVIYRYFNGFGLSEEIRFMCYNITKRLWCEFKPCMHRWIEDTEENAGHCMRQTFDIDIYRLYTVEYEKHIAEKISKALEEDDSEQEQNLQKHKEKIFKLTNQLKITSFRDTLLKECCNRFIYKGCRDLLDTNLDLIGFTNGVYDLENGVFRDGTPSDYISISTNLEYSSYNYNSPEIIEIQHILSQILPIKSVREYFLHVLSSCLSGKQWFEKFFVLTGSGSNGKSKLIDLIQNTLGDYYHQMNVSALCSKRAASNAADPELAMLRGRRFVAFQEPSKDEPINVGKLKEWTGGDTIQCRELYKGPIKFKSQAKWFLICNDIPDVPSDDDGTWRRLTIINFPSKFIPKSEMTGRHYEYLRDNNMNEKLECLKEPFMWLLLDYYKSFLKLMKTTGLVEPKAIIDSTNNERKKNNPIKQFIDDRIMYSPNKSDKFSIADIYNVFRNFMIDSGHNNKLIPKRTEFSLKFNIEYVNIIKKNTGKTIEIDKKLSLWNNVTYMIDSNINNKNESQLIESDSDDDNNTESFSNIDYNSDSNKNYGSDSD